MLSRCRSRLPNFKPMMGKRLMFADISKEDFLSSPLMNVLPLAMVTQMRQTALNLSELFPGFMASQDLRDNP